MNPLHFLIWVEFSDILLLFYFVFLYFSICNICLRNINQSPASVTPPVCSDFRFSSLNEQEIGSVLLSILYVLYIPPRRKNNAVGM